MLVLQLMTFHYKARAMTTEIQMSKSHPKWPAACLRSFLHCLLLMFSVSIALAAQKTQQTSLHYSSTKLHSNTFSAISNNLLTIAIVAQHFIYTIYLFIRPYNDDTEWRCNAQCIQLVTDYRDVVLQLAHLAAPLSCNDTGQEVPTYMP